MTIIENALIGSKQIKVNINHEFNIFDTIKINDNYYFIKSIIGNVLTLSEKLKTNVVVNDVIEYSNLTGIYETTFMLDESDIYTIIIRNETHSLSLAIKIVDETLSEQIINLSFNNKTFV